MEEMALPLTHRFSIDDFLRMAETGILHDDDRVELIEGEIVEMSPIGPPHQGVVDWFTRAFITRLGERAIVRIQGPISIPKWSMPQPDVIVLVARADFYRKGHPEPPGDVALVIEVSDSTVAYDRRVKLPLYARSGVTEAWIVDLPAGLVQVCREPGPHGYGFSVEVLPGGTVSPLAFPDVTLEVADILG